jgi:hypothetical protein
VAEHALQTCLRENGEHIGMAATIAQQAKLVERQAAEIAALKQAGVVLPPSPYMPGVEPESLSDYERGEAQGRCDMWAEVARLNASRDVAPFDLKEFARRAAVEMEKHDFHGFEPVVLAVVEDMLAAPTPAPAHSAHDLEMVMVPRELLEHVKHARKELLRMDRAPLSVRQKLAQKLTDLLAGCAQ